MTGTSRLYFWEWGVKGGWQDYYKEGFSLRAVSSDSEFSNISEKAKTVPPSIRDDIKGIPCLSKRLEWLLRSLKQLCISKSWSRRIPWHCIVLYFCCLPHLPVLLCYSFGGGCSKQELKKADESRDMENRKWKKKNPFFFKGNYYMPQSVLGTMCIIMSSYLTLMMRLEDI